MDNGQFPRNPKQDSQALFQDGLTPGVGTASGEANPLPPTDNLSQETFTEEGLPREYGSIGSVAMNAPMATGDIIELSMPPSLNNTDNTAQLGQIVDLSTPPSHKETQQPANDISSDHEESDAAIDAHFADGKINEGDVGYIKTMENELDPVALVEFVMKARKKMTEKGNKNE